VYAGLGNKPGSGLHLVIEDTPVQLSTTSPTPDGVASAFEAAWVHDRVVFRAARASGFSEEESREIVQDTFVEYWKVLQRGYVVRDAKALLIHIGRRQHQRRWAKADRAPGPETTAVVGAQQERWALWRDVEQVLGALDQRSREVLVLLHVAGLKYREIAEELGVPIGTVQSRVARARAAFRELWEGR
jgi:RNA polymerase sigma-70 factor (ECF subfamily)